MKAITRLYVSVMAGLILAASGFAQDRCSNAYDYFEPVLSGDGQRLSVNHRAAGVASAGLRCVSGKSIGRADALGVRDAIHERVEPAGEDSIGGGGGSSEELQSEREEPGAVHQGRVCGGDGVLVAVERWTKPVTLPKSLAARAV